MQTQTDIRAVLPTVMVPTLVLHRTDDTAEPVEQARYIGEHVPNAEVVELPGNEHAPFAGDAERVLRELRRFVSAVRDEEAEFDRVLATVLFTDLVGSTERAAALGDRAWRELVERHHTVIRGLLARYRGTEVDTAGDGFFATFDGPARAVRCARAIIDAVQPLGLDVRAGVHTGEVETIDGKAGGLAVNIGARVAAVGSTARASRVIDGEGPDGRIRTRVRGCRSTRVEGHPGDVAPVPRRQRGHLGQATTVSRARVCGNVA